MKKWVILILVFSLSMTSYAKEEPEQLYAQSAVLMDADSGRVLFEKNGTDIKAMASTTKIMTCILALELGDENQIVTFSKNAQKQPKVHLGATEGEQFYLRDLLFSLMLESHNDSAVAIAEAVAGDVQKFANLMNQKAKELGCDDTYFITPNGLDASDENGTHSTTAIDLAKIMSYCIKHSPKSERFLEITQTAQHSFANQEGTKFYSCVNHNSFLSMMDEAISGKTGFTADAGYCYVGAVESEGRTFVVSLLACGWPNNKNYKWADMRKIISYAMENYEYREIEAPSEFQKIKVLNGIPETEGLFDEAFVDVDVENDVQRYYALMHKEDEVNVIVKQEENLEAPVEQAEEVGTITYYLNEELIMSLPIITTEAIDEKTFSWYFMRLLSIYGINTN